MKIRLMGTTDEVTEAVVVLRHAFDVVDESRLFPCRTPSRLTRLYLEVRITVERGGDQ